MLWILLVASWVVGESGSVAVAKATVRHGSHLNILGHSIAALVVLHRREWLKAHSSKLRVDVVAKLSVATSLLVQANMQILVLIFQLAVTVLLKSIVSDVMR